MKAFWWFKKNAVAGMARPGFNGTHIYDLSFDEMTVLSWLGQHSCGDVALQTFEDHLEKYMPRIFALIKMDQSEGKANLARLTSPEGLEQALQLLNRKSGFFQSFDLTGDHLKFKLNFNHLDREIEFLKAAKINSIVSLTERHHQRDELSQHFDTHHISIEDLGAPNLAQAQELAKIIETSRSQDKRVAVHCLAGVGRTSTMIIAAHAILGEDLDRLIEEMQLRNPSYKLSGSQLAFLESLR